MWCPFYRSAILKDNRCYPASYWLVYKWRQPHVGTIWNHFVHCNFEMSQLLANSARETWHPGWLCSAWQSCLLQGHDDWAELSFFWYFFLYVAYQNRQNCVKSIELFIESSISTEESSSIHQLFPTTTLKMSKPFDRGSNRYAAWRRQGHRAGPGSCLDSDTTRIDS